MNVWEFCSKHFVGICVMLVVTEIMVHDTLLLFTR